MARIILLLCILLSHDLSAQNKADSLSQLLKNMPLDSNKINTYLKLHDELRLSNFIEASKIARISYLEALNLDWEKGIAHTGRNFGVALNLLGKYDSAIDVLNKSIFYSKAIGDTSNVGYCLMTLGNIQYDQTNYDEALAYYTECLATYKSIDNYAGMSSAMIWIGIIYQYAQSDYASAIEVYKEAIGYAELGNSSLNKGYIYGNLATIYNDTQSYDSALFYYRKALVIKQKHNDERGIGNGYNNIANVYFNLSKMDSALFYYHQGLTIRRKMEDQTGIASSCVNIGRVLMDLGQIREAEEFLEEAYEVSERVNYKEAMQQSALLLSQIFEKQRRYDRALEFHKKYKIIGDSIFNIESDRAISAWKTKYETEKKEQQIALQELQLAEQKVVNQRNQILLASSGGIIVLLVLIGFQGHSRLKWKNRQLLEEQKRLAREAEMNAVISSQEKERNRFARDLHDGFGQLISTLNLNLKNLSNPKDKEERERVFDASARVLDEMYQELKNICFDLMPQTLIRHGLEAALNEFANRINVTGEKHVEVNVFGLDERLTDLQEISLYRIAQEWVNNILKYSDAQKIVLQVTKDADEVTLLIEDDGAGFDQAKLTRGKGNGWRNITSRANLIHGELEIDSQPGTKGTTLILNATLQKEQQPLEYA